MISQKKSSWEPNAIIFFRSPSRTGAFKLAEGPSFSPRRFENKKGSPFRTPPSRVPHRPHVSLSRCSPSPHAPVGAPAAAPTALMLGGLVVSASGADTAPSTARAVLHTAQAVVLVALVLVGAVGQAVLVPAYALRTPPGAATAVGAAAVPEAAHTRVPMPGPAPGAATAVRVVAVVHGTARAQPPLMGLPPLGAYAVVAAAPVPAVCTPRFRASSAA